MSKTVYKKKIKNDKEYYFYRLRHKNLKQPRDIYASTVKKLEHKIKFLTNELDHGITDNKEYFGAFFKEWLYNAHLINKKPSTKERYDGIYRNYIDGSSIYTIKLKDISSPDIQGYYNALIKDGKSTASLNALHKLIKPCIRYAYDNNKVIKDFSRSIIIPKEDRIDKPNDVRPFTLEEQFKFLEVINDDELEILFASALDTGSREGELFALTWNDIDFNNKYIDINKSYKLIKNIDTGKYEGIVQTPKTENAIRTVPIPNHLINKLKKHKLDQIFLKVKIANLYDDKNLVFCNMHGNYLDSSNVLKKLKKILRKNNLKEITFHDLRHTYATRLFELGENPKTVQVLLGHSNISITLNTYTHVLDNMKVKAITRLDDIYIKYADE
jgi:integrase